MDNNAVSRELVVRVVRGNYRKVPPEIENHMDSAVAYKAVVLSHAKRVAARRVVANRGEERHLLRANGTSSRRATNRITNANRSAHVLSRGKLLVCSYCDLFAVA
jgi:hypothetical protein